MTARRDFVAAVAAVAVPAAVAAAIAIVATAGPAGSPVGSPARPPVAVAEDSPAWDCETMGNRICGPVAVDLGPDGTATVRDAVGTYATVGDATYVADLGYGPEPYLSELDLCGSPVPSGPLGVTVLASGPSAVREGTTRAAIVADGGRCLVAVGTVALY